MSDLIPKSPTTTRVGGLSPKAQRLAAARAKLANAQSGSKPIASSNSPAAKPLAGTKKTSFQRKAT